MFVGPCEIAMAFRDFTFPSVQTALGIAVDEVDLYPQVPAVPLREEFVAAITDGANLALAINTEKAKSEFIIAPVLMELRRMLPGAFGLFSGVELDVDAARGLNGLCDFILTRAPKQFILTAPLVAIVEAKNDNLRSGLGQCVAAMVAAQLFNQKSGVSLPTVFGVVTTGSAWKFLHLQQEIITLDIREYYIDNLGKILGVFKHIMESA